MDDHDQVVDAIIIGAGVSGLYQLLKLRQLGLDVALLEAGTGVGGTWYWNRYPGARFDSESYSYGYSFDPVLQQEWEWTEHFSPQPETLRYLQHVAERYDLERDIRFESRVETVHRSPDDTRWRVGTQDGARPRGGRGASAVASRAPALRLRRSGVPASSIHDPGIRNS